MRQYDGFDEERTCLVGRQTSSCSTDLILLIEIILKPGFEPVFLRNLYVMDEYKNDEQIELMRKSAFTGKRDIGRSGKILKPG